VLAFPCNQFNNQEPGTNAEVLAFAQTNYGVTFPMHAKIEVNGENAHPLYQYLRGQAKGLLGTTGIKWNFTKFLVDRRGKVLDRYAPQTTPTGLLDKIQALL
jgi:glutathione peroxidase